MISLVLLVFCLVLINLAFSASSPTNSTGDTICCVLIVLIGIVIWVIHKRQPPSHIVSIELPYFEKRKRFPEYDRYRGELKASNLGWHIELYLPGPDMRYNGDRIIINPNDLTPYIQAYEENWKRYKELKAMKKEEKKITMKGKKNMTINAGGPFDGVCIRSYHLPIKTERKLKEFIETLKWAEKRGIEVMKAIKNKTYFKKSSTK